MFFCDNCDSLFNITKQLPNDINPIDEQNEGQYEGQYDFFFCSICGNTKKIIDGTLLFQRYNNHNNNILNPGKAVLDIYPQRSNYTCQNTKCKTHKDPNLNKALTIYKNTNYEIAYICNICQTIQDIEIV